MLAMSMRPSRIKWVTMPSEASRGMTVEHGSDDSTIAVWRDDGALVITGTLSTDDSVLEMRVLARSAQ